MQVNTREARKQLSRLIKAVERGERVEITRRGRIVAQLAPPNQQPDPGKSRAAARSELRDHLPPASEPSARLLRKLREERD